ncbi:MAG: hypothetical protein ABIG66_01190 [Candidatus Kerfeldbacteria bacterium]
MRHFKLRFFLDRRSKELFNVCIILIFAQSARRRTKKLMLPAVTADVDAPSVLLAVAMVKHAERTFGGAVDRFMPHDSVVLVRGQAVSLSGQIPHLENCPAAQLRQHDVVRRACRLLQATQLCVKMTRQTGREVPREFFDLKSALLSFLLMAYHRRRTDGLFIYLGMDDDITNCMAVGVYCPSAIKTHQWYHWPCSAVTPQVIVTIASQYGSWPIKVNMN